MLDCTCRIYNLWPDMHSKLVHPLCICLSQLSLTNSLRQIVKQDRVCVDTFRGGDTMEKLTSLLLLSDEAMFYLRG